MKIVRMEGRVAMEEVVGMKGEFEGEGLRMEGVGRDGRETRNGGWVRIEGRIGRKKGVRRDLGSRGTNGGAWNEEGIEMEGEVVWEDGVVIKGGVGSRKR